MPAIITLAAAIITDRCKSRCASERAKYAKRNKALVEMSNAAVSTPWKKKCSGLADSHIPELSATIRVAIAAFEKIIRANADAD